MIQLYGQWADYTSIPNVSRALATAIRDQRWLLNIWAHGAIVPKYEAAPWPAALHSSAYVGIYVGYPGAAAGFLKGHSTRVLVTVCETNVIPKEWVAACSEVEYVIVPSQFCKQVFIDSGVRKPVVVVPHGISFFGEHAPAPHKTVEFLHVTGAASFPHRKGTPALLRAWQTIEKEFPQVRLTLRAFREPRLVQYIEHLGLTTVEFDDTPSLSPAAMADYLATFDATIQPSRGEGFGLVPLEGRANGVPAIMTFVSGHGEHAAPGVDIQIETGPYRPLTTQGNAEGFAPSVEPDAIVAAVRTFMSDIDGHKNRTALWAARFGPLWSWKNTLKPLLTILEPIAKRKDRQIRFGEDIGVH